MRISGQIMNMHWKPFLFLLAVSLGMLSVSVHAVQSKSELVPVPGTKVRIAVPENFIPSANFTGFISAETGCSLVVTEIEGPFDRVSAGFSRKQALRERGMEVLSREPRSMGFHSGVLMKIVQTVGELQVQKWAWLFGNAESTVIVMGVCPLELVESELDMLRETVITAVWDPEHVVDPLAVLSFRFGDIEGMKFFSSTAGAVSFTPSGKDNKNEPLFICTPGLRPVEGDRRKFVDRDLRETRYYDNYQLGPIEPITIDRLSGYACLATARDTKSKTPSFIYLVVLYEGNSRWTMKGIASESAREQYLPLFERLAGSFRRKSETLSATDGTSELTIPATWTRRQGIQEDAEIQAGHIVGDCYAVVLSEPKDDFVDGTSYETHNLMTRAWLEEDSGTQPVPEQMKIGELDALRSEYDIKTGDLEIHYVHLTIDGAEHFHQVLLWCATASLEWSLSELDHVAKSFRETN